MCYHLLHYFVSDSYAHKSGLAIGDYVITINGINTGNMSLQEVNDKIKSVSLGSLLNFIVVLSFYV